jgi:hypothetical protein
MSPPASSTAQSDANAPHLSTKPPNELSSQAEKIDEKSVAENVKPAESEPARELAKDTQPHVVSSVAKVEVEMARMAREFEERAAKQVLMYAQQNKMFENILAQMAEMSGAEKSRSLGRMAAVESRKRGLRGGRVMKTCGKYAMIPTAVGQRPLGPEAWWGMGRM